MTLTKSVEHMYTHGMIESLLKKFKWTSEKRKSKIKQTENLNLVKPDKKLLKLLKDRFNYASSTCSARILSTSPSTQSPSALLSSSKDSYLRFSCSKASKFIVLELCEEVKIDAIVMANYELFSGTLKGFKVYGAAADKLIENSQVVWKLIISGELQEKGPFLHADQAFPLTSISDSFIKYLRIEFDEEFYGHEDLCPISVFKVYGKTMLDEFNEELKGKIKSENLPIYSDELVLSPELKDLIEEMSKISSKLSEEELNNSFFINQNMKLFNPKCIKREQVAHELKDKYSALERKSFHIQIQSKTSGNVFKHLHERLNKLESSLKHPLNLILFRSRRHEHDSGSEIPRLLPNHQADKSVEELFSGLNDDIFYLKQNLKHLQSDLSAQQTKITILIAFNSLLLCLILISLLKKLFTKPANMSIPNMELRRRPLLELKSTSNSSITNINHFTSKSMTSSPKLRPNTPGLVLSDDEVLLLDESIRE